MNEKPKPFWRKSWPLPRWVVVCLEIVLVALVIAAVVLGWQNGPPRNWTDSMIMSEFSLGIVAAILSVCLWKWRCFRWRDLQRGLFLLACLMTIIALFYAEEDWRGKRAWEQFQREAAVNGVSLDTTSVVPPPVPDDQNFALTPLVASSYGQMLDRTGHEIRPRNTNVVNRLSMRYWLDGDGAPSELTGWMVGEPTDLAALQHYYRALAAKTNTLKLPPSPQAPAADVLTALSRFDPTVEELRQAAQLPGSRFPLEYDKDNPGAILLPHLAAVKCADQMLSLRATAELQTGQGDQALADVKLQLRLVETVRNEPFIISHLVRIAMVQLALQPVWEGLADHRWSEPQLMTLEAELVKLDFLTDYQTCMRADLAFMVREFDYLRWHPDQYFKLNVEWYFGSPLATPNSDFTMAVFMAGHVVPSGWLYQNEVRYDRAMKEFYWPAADVQAHTFAPAPLRACDAFLTNECRQLSPYNILECLFLQWPISFNTGSTFAHGQAAVGLARVAIALERRRLAQGHFPEALTALTPQYLEALPHDVIGGQPLHYRLTDDGQFVLYSVGWNETDDGGVAVRASGRTEAQDFSQGDWVWRYPPANQHEK